MIHAPKKLTPSEWKPEEDGPEFTLRPLDGIEMLEAGDYMVFSEDRNTLVPAKACAILIKYGLVGWKDYKDADGNVVEYSPFHDVNLKALPFSLIRDMAKEIIDRSDLGEEDKKKS